MMKSRRMTWVKPRAHMRQTSNAYKMLAGKPEGKISLKRPRHR
jgi:hypothetical protein